MSIAKQGVGIGGTITNANATNSICPKGWKMATSGDTSVPANIGNGSFYFMLDKYGLTSSVTSATGYNIASRPLYFVRSGYFDTVNTVVGGANHENDYWSATSGSVDNSRSYYPHANDEVMNAALLNWRMYGLSLRAQRKPAFREV